MMMFRATSSSHNNPEGQLVPASTTLHHLREDHDMQKALSLMLAEATPMDNQNQWREINYNPSSQEIAAEEAIMNLQGAGAAASGFDTPSTDSMMKNSAHQELLASQVHGPFKSWRHTKILAPVLENNNSAANQLLLRRCIKLMKQIPHIHQSSIAQTEGTTLVETMNQQGPPTTSSESPETVQEIAQVLEPIPVFQVTKRKPNPLLQGNLELSFTSTRALVGSWLFCKVSKYYSVHAWSPCGGLNKELSTLVH
jgi:hypothetical protein